MNAEHISNKLINYAVNLKPEMLERIVDIILNLENIENMNELAEILKGV